MKGEDKTLMNLQFKMKRTRSSDSVGINNYKRQRLIQDFENLTLGTKCTEKAINTSQTGIVSTFGDVFNEKLWSIVEREMRQNDNDKTYERLWSKVREYNMQVIKWYSWPHLLYARWYTWIQSNLKCITMNFDVNFAHEKRLFMDDDSNFSTPLNDTDMNIDSDYDVDMDVDIDIDANTG